MKTKTSRSEKTMKLAAPAPRPGPPIRTGGDDAHLQSKTAGSNPIQASGEPSPQPLPHIPSILFEGDILPSLPGANPAQKRALGGTPPAAPCGATEVELPAAYGTESIQLSARDPYWLYANWDLTSQQQLRHNALSVDHHLILRVHPGVKKEPIQEVHLHPESRHWFLQVERAEAGYVVELGYYQADRQWRSIATSAAARTPPDRVAEDRSVRWAKASPSMSRAGLGSFAGRGTEAGVALRYALAGLSQGAGSFPTSTAATCAPRTEVAPGTPGMSFGNGADSPEVLRTVQPDWGSEWTPAQEQALAEEVSRGCLRRHQCGSGEIAEVLRLEGEQKALTSPVAISSRVGEAALPSPSFWLNVNAELIVYGQTEPGARVAIGGQPVTLDADGRFSCRFALPEGQHQLVVEAISARNEYRQTELSFNRRTVCQGEVGEQPPDPALLPLGAENAT